MEDLPDDGADLLVMFSAWVTSRAGYKPEPLMLAYAFHNFLNGDVVIVTSPHEKPN